MLKIAGYINILIAIGHILGLIWADKMFEVTGIENEMMMLATYTQHSRRRASL